MSKSLHGLIAAPFTPFHVDGSLAPEIIPAFARQLVRNGVNGAFICGTTGEGHSLSAAERREVAEAWRAATPPELALIVHVGHLSYVEGRELAAHAQKIGADAIASIAPSFFKPASVGELVDWCALVAAGAPDLPFYYYHMPSMTGVTVKAASFLALARDRIPNLAGVKFTFEDLEDFSASLAVDPEKFDVFFGRDEILLSGLELGARGAVGSTYNYSAPVYQKVIAAHAAGDLETARREQARAQAFIEVMARHGGLPAGKAIMQLIGIDCGPVRRPLRSLDAAAIESLRAGLAAIGFFDYANQL